MALLHLSCRSCCSRDFGRTSSFQPFQRPDSLPAPCPSAFLTLVVPLVTLALRVRSTFRRPGAATGLQEEFRGGSF